ncbi:MAG: acyltransferase [Bacteroidetes bacterium]|nr:acyltransferase [Bacteroidota bacterium]
MTRKFGLDIIRTFSIWLVILQHFGLHPFGLRIGAIGVEIFFVLSGFLIGQILLNDFAKKLNLKTVVHFWIRRWFRILPLYYLVLLLKFVFIDSSIRGNIFYYVFFLQNNFYGISYLNVSWSLVIEEWFYLLAPFFVLLTLKIGGEKKWIHLTFFLVFILLENIGRLIYIKLFNAPYDGVNGNVLLRFDSLFVGLMMAYVKLNFQLSFKKLSNSVFLIIGMALFFVFCVYISKISIPNYQLNTLLFPRTLGKIVLSTIICLMIPFFDELEFHYERNVLKWIIAKFVLWTSLLTYSIYLIHVFVIERVLTSNSVFSFLWFEQCLLSILIIYTFSFLVYRFFEKPIMGLRDKFK